MIVSRQSPAVQIQAQVHGRVDLSHFASRIEPVAPSATRSDLTWAEFLEVGAARNGALYDAEHIAGLTTAEVSARVRQAEADAIAAVQAKREQVASDHDYLTLAEIEAEDEVRAENHRQFYDRKPVATVAPEQQSPWKSGDRAIVGANFPRKECIGAEIVLVKRYPPDFTADWEACRADDGSTICVREPELLPVAPEPDGPRPTAEDTVSISRIGELEWLGFTLGCNGEPVVGSPEYSPAEREAFLRGHARGFQEWEEEQLGDADFAEWADARRERYVSQAELVESGAGAYFAVEGGAR